MMMNFRSIAAGSLHLLKREIKSSKRPSSVIARLQLTTRAPFTTESGGTATSDQNKGRIYTKDEVIGWVTRLDKEGKHGYALKILEYMDETKAEFSPSDLALYVEILVKVRGLAAAKAYFKKVDPDFNHRDVHAKNWPAYATLVRLTSEGYTERGINAVPGFGKRCRCRVQEKNPFFSRI